MSILLIFMFHNDITIFMQQQGINTLSRHFTAFVYCDICDYYLYAIQTRYRSQYVI